MNKLEFKGLEDNCPDCGNVMYFRKNSSQGCFCLKSECNYGYATTYIPEILKDSTIYEVCVVSLGDNWKQALVFLALKFNFSTKEVLKFKNPREVLFKGNASEVFQNRKKLAEKNITISISPEYKYEVWNINPQEDFSTS